MAAVFASFSASGVFHHCLKGLKVKTKVLSLLFKTGFIDSWSVQTDKHEQELFKPGIDLQSAWYCSGLGETDVMVRFI